jgi:quercetin dioxygenase-like cupin family protein
MPEIINHNYLEKVKQSFDAWKLFNGEKTEIVRVHLKSGEHIENHVNPVNVFFFILSGEGELSVGQENYKMGINDLTFVEGGLQRSWKNNAKGELRFLVIKEI